MTVARGADTIVIQSFRKKDIPAWIQRCLDSVANWAALHGYEYCLPGDEFYELCGPDYLGRGSKNPQAITNLARLVATRQRLDAGYARAIWMDADMFVFDPASLTFDFPAASLELGYAFGREVWLSRSSNGTIQTEGPMAHNAATFFTQAAVDLDMLIELIRHIDAKRRIVSNYQVGVRLLRGLQNSLMFPTFSHAAVFSPELMRALLARDEAILRQYGRAYRYPAFAANLGLSLNCPEDMLWKTMDLLEEGRGEPINKFATETGVHLVPYA